jgi:hypothetical protein
MRDVSDKARLNYVVIRLGELAEERARLIAERKALTEKLRAARSEGPRG